MSRLPNFTLLNTRPAHQADALSQQITQMHGCVLACPTLDIQWCFATDKSAREPGLIDAYDKVIFTSANAVRGIFHCPLKQSLIDPLSRREAIDLDHYSPQTQCYAIGLATQQAGLEYELPLEVLSKSAFDSEALLAHPVMKSIQGESIVIVKGCGGRDLLTKTLRSRGAKVESVDVYQRVPAPFCRPQWQAFIQSPHPILLITSVESFESLFSCLVVYDEKYANLSDQAWSFLKETIVFSQRIKHYMLAKGWQSPIEVVSQQSNQGIIQTIERCLLNA